MHSHSLSRFSISFDLLCNATCFRGCVPELSSDANKDVHRSSALMNVFHCVELPQSRGADLHRTDRQNPGL